MTTLAFSPELLSIVSLIQSKRLLSLNESLTLGEKDYVQETQDYYYELPERYVVGIGLEYNEACFHAIIGQPITRALLTAETENLKDFDFVY